MDHLSVHGLFLTQQDVNFKPELNEIFKFIAEKLYTLLKSNITELEVLFHK